MFYFGVDYYPEHWQPSRWETDVKLMKEVGFNVVRLAEFAWSLMEPEDGVFEFAWLDDAIDLLAQHGIQVVLGTPSAAVPPWIWQKVPDLALVNENNVTLEYGSRRDYSPTNPAYRFYATRIARKMAEHYKDNPQVIGWQIDNEFGDRCYSVGTRLAFQQWLKQKYGTLEDLNECWGTRFWSHVYTDWSQIPVPVKTIHGIHNPGLHLDYYRFISEMYVDFQQLQVDAIREIVPTEQLITHNLMGFGYPNIDYFELAKSLDFVTWDNYPRGFWVFNQDVAPAPLALGHSLIRSLKKKNFWVMEQQSGQGAWDTLPPVPRPGEIALWAYQSIAHGADGIVFFRWRTNRYGAEEYWHGVIDHDGKPRRRYAEIKAMGKQINHIGDIIAESEIRAEVAILHSYDTRFAFQIQPNNPGFSYEEHTYDYFQAFHDRNIPVDIVSPEEDLSPYKLVIVPSLYVTEAETARRLNQFVEAGGTIVVTARSGVKDHYNAVVEMALPGLLANVCGVEVEEYDSLLSGTSRQIKFDGLDGSGLATLWCDLLKVNDAKVLARYDEDFYAGTPVVTQKSLGDGYALYIGTMGDEALVASVVNHVLSLAEITHSIESPQGVEVTSRWNGNEQLMFVLNHSNDDQMFNIDNTCTDLLSDETQAGSVTLKPKQVMILRATN